MYYAHIEIDDNIKDGEVVFQGQRIGKIETDRMAANCNVSVLAITTGEPTERATGPHLHIELFKNKKQETLDGKEFGRFVVKAGAFHMDRDIAKNCNFADDCTKAYREIHNRKEYCATRFVDKNKSSNIYCASVEGANNGKYKFFQCIL